MTPIGEWVEVGQRGYRQWGWADMAVDEVKVIGAAASADEAPRHLKRIRNSLGIHQRKTATRFALMLGANGEVSVKRLG